MTGSGGAMKKSDELYVLSLALHSVDDKFEIYESIVEAEAARDKVQKEVTNLFGIRILTLTEFMSEYGEMVRESFHQWY